MKKFPPPPSPEHLKFAVLASDIVLFTYHNQKLLVRYVLVDRPPYFVNSTGLPGGLIDPKETAEDAALRHIKSKTKIDPKKVYLEQLYTFSEIERDPRGRVVAVAYIGFVPWERLTEEEQESSDGTWWEETSKKKKLAYDHDDILQMALDRFSSRITYTTLIGKILPEEFTLTDLEQTYSAILKTPLDKRNFRKKLNKLNILTKVPRKKTGGRARPAQLFKFKAEGVKEIEML